MIITKRGHRWLAKIKTQTKHFAAVAPTRGEAMTLAIELAKGL